MPIEDAQALVGAITQALGARRKDVALAALETAKWHTIQNVVKVHLDILEGNEKFMNVIYLGLLFCEESLQDEIKAKTGKIAMAPHKFQSSLLQGLEAQPNVNLSVINVPPTGSFPRKGRTLCSKAYTWGKQYNQIGYVNLPWVKHKIQTYKIYRQVKRKISNSEPTYLILYSLYEPFLKVAHQIKHRYPDVHVCLLHTDAVPGRDDLEQYMTKRAKKRGDRAVRLTKSFDSFILLAENLVEPLEVDNRPYLVVECLCNEHQKAADTQSSVRNSFLYTGGVKQAYGICELANAFEQIPDAQLWICGDGDAREEIVKICSRLPNVQFLGFVMQEKVTELQNRCAFLINPRRPSGTYTKYSFPSKTAEYMMTAKPVVMYKLEALPDDYDQYLNYLTGATPEEIAVELRALMATDYALLEAKAQKGRNYMMENKVSAVAAKRIVDFLMHARS